MDDLYWPFGKLRTIGPISSLDGRHEVDVDLIVDEKRHRWTILAHLDVGQLGSVEALDDDSIEPLVEGRRV